MKALRNDVTRHNPSSTLPHEINLEESEAVFYVYILASERNGDALGLDHARHCPNGSASKKRDLHPRDFTSTHAVHTLVHVEEFDDLYEAITRYNWLRHAQPDDLRRLIDEENPKWRDLYGEYTS